MNNVKNIVKEGLCSGCGGCSGVCPTNAINFYEDINGIIKPCINDNKCMECGLCLKICPSNSSQNYFNNSELVGNYINSYIGYSKNEFYRNEGQSGGVVNSLIEYLIGKKEIDVAYNISFDKAKKRPKVNYIKDKSDIKQTSGSYYTQVPLLEKVLNDNKDNYLIVSLGCQTSCLKNVTKQVKNKKMPKYNFGLFCAGVFSSMIIDDLISKSGISNKDIKNFRFRSKNAGGWPGNVLISSQEKDHQLDKSYRYKLKKIYALHRCYTCNNKLNRGSDISFGDPWGIEKIGSKGKTVFITRTKRGEDLINRSISEGVIHAERISINKILNGQHINDIYLDNLKYVSKLIRKDFLKNYDSSNGIYLNKYLKSKYYRSYLFYKMNNIEKLNKFKEKIWTEIKIDQIKTFPRNFLFRLYLFIKKILGRK